MLNQIEALLQDGQLSQKIKAAKSLDEAIKLMAIADAEKGDNFTREDISQMLSKLASGSGNEWEVELSEEDLLSVAGGVVSPTHPEQGTTHDDNCPTLISDSHILA